MDTALINGNSFAIVPCCVFPHLYPQRRLCQLCAARADWEIDSAKESHCGAFKGSA